MIIYRRRYIAIKGKPPCCGVYEYSFDKGKTWITQKRFNEYLKTMLVEEGVATC